MGRKREQPEGELCADRQADPDPDFQAALPEHICSEEEAPSSKGSLPLLSELELAQTAGPLGPQVAHLR